MPNIIIRRIISKAPNYKFRNSQALTYWNALTVANAAEVGGSQYNISRISLKKAIDNFFITGNTDGWLINMSAMYLYIGGTANTHAINAITPGTFNLTFIGSPTQSSSGFGTLNGTTQYARTGLIDSTSLSINNVHISAKSSTNSATGTKIYIGAAVSTTQRTFIDYLTTSSANVGDCHSNIAGTGRCIGTTNSTLGWICMDRISNIRMDLYYNATSEANSLLTAGTQPNIEFYLGALNNAGVAANFSDFLYTFHSIGSSLGQSKATSLNNALNTLQTALNR